MTVLSAAAETHTGYVRSTNQDLALVSGDLVAVADGMGGHLGGEVAARTAIEELLEAYLRERTADGLVSAARRANRAVWRKSRVDRNLHGMGTTLTAAALVNRSAGVGDEGGNDKRTHLILVNVGDSRAYVLDKDTRRLRQLTEDHSVVEEMVRQGELTPEEAAVHPHRHVLTRALGIEAEVTLDIWDLGAEVGSRFLLCSDGLTNELSDQEIAAVLAAAANPEQAARELVGRALGHGGMDNVTVVVADVVEGDIDLTDVPELVPPRPPRPEAPVMGTPELTEAVPVSAPAGTPAVTPPGAPAPGGTPPGSGALGLPVTGGTGATGLAGAPIAAAASGLAGEVAAAASDGVTSEVAAAPPAGRARRKGRSMTAPLAATPAVTGGVTDGVIDGDGLVGPDPGTAGAPRDTGEHARQGESAFLVDDLGGMHTRPIVLVRQKRDRAPRDRIVTFRVVVFVLLLVALIGGTAGVIIWYDQTSYFIALHGDSVGIYEGRPGGMLWFKPQLIETSRITVSELLPSTIATLHDGLSESSLSAAEHVAARLKNEKARALAAVTTTTTATTSTTSTTTTTTTTFQGTFPPATAPPTTAAPTTTRPPPTTQAPTTTTKPKQSGTTPPSTSATTTTTTTGKGN